MQNQTIQEDATQTKKKSFWSDPVYLVLILLAASQLLVIQQQEQAKPIIIPQQQELKDPQWLNEVPSDIQKPQTVYTKSH